MAKLLRENNLEDAISLAEIELKSIKQTDFHQILNKDLHHLKKGLNKYLTDFYNSADSLLRNMDKGFLDKLLGKKSKSYKTLKSIYCEMNGFTINYDKWFLDAFGFSSFQGLDDLDWLADFETESTKSFTITGFESLQSTYQDYMENEKWNDSILEKASETCELLIILKLQQLFKNTLLENIDKKSNWTTIPVLFTAHDFDMIYKTI